MQTDVRWKQRFFNLKMAFAQLEKAVEIEKLSELERSGLIQTFEFTYELAWNTLKDWLHENGFLEIRGSKDAIRQAFSEGLIADGHAWMKMVESRTKTSHTYQTELAEQVEHEIRDIYYLLFQQLIAKLEYENLKK